MITLTLLLPELQRVAPFDRSQYLARWVSRGDKLADAKTGRAVALRESFEFLGTGFPHAALARYADSSDVAGALWLNADPAYVVADAVTLRMLACGDIGVSAEENAELAQSLRTLFGDAGFPLDVSSSGRWQLRCARESRLPRFATPSKTLGDDLARHLPSGDNERQWRHLLNEAQVILHNQPINERRTRCGQIPANSVWFWGAGALPDWVRTTFTHVVSADPEVVALAKMANVAVIESDWSTAAMAENSLLDLGNAGDGDRLDGYLIRIDDGLRTRKIRELKIAFADGARYAYSPSHRWRFWRSIKPLAP
ncbi:MAG: phosphoglycerate mutase [Rudaea sp.]